MMGMQSFFNKPAKWALSLVLVLLASGYTVVAQAASGNVCNSATNSANDKSCSFSSSGLQQTFSSGSSLYGSLFGSGFGGGGNGGNFGATSSLGSTRFALNSGDTGKAAAGMGSNWNAWLSLSQSNVAYKFQPLQSSGRVNVTLVGIDYTFSNNATVGVAAAWDQSRIGTTFNGGNLNSNGNMVAPYLSWRFSQAWSLDASLGLGRSNISQVDNSAPGGIYGNYSDKRFLASVALAYSKMVGKWMLTGRGAYLTSEDKYSQFSLSSGTSVDAATSRSSQLRVGGQAMYNGGSLLPYAGVYYFNDVQRATQGAVGGANPANDRDGFQLQVGIQFAPKGQVYGGLLLATDVGRSQVKNDLFLGNIGIRF